MIQPISSRKTAHSVQKHPKDRHKSLISIDINHRHILSLDNHKAPQNLPPQDR
jgi:hypothetical protein